MPSLKASETGLRRLKAARNERGWTFEDPRWLLEASQLIDPSVAGTEFFAYGISEGTWNRLFRGIAINTPAFKAYCQVLGIDWESVVDRPAISVPTALAKPSQREIAATHWHDLEPWESVAPSLTNFQGRYEDLQCLQTAAQASQLIALVGLGGIGKTALAAKLTELLAPKFDTVIWKSLRSAPTLSQLTQLLTPLSDLFSALKSQRTLLVLDSWDAMMSGDRAGCVRSEYADYEEFLQQITKNAHPSCVILTSREEPQLLSRLLAPNAPIVLHRVTGLVEDAISLLDGYGLTFDRPEAWTQLISLYGGNPLFLNIAASVIKNLFNGSVTEFLQEGTIVASEFESIVRPWIHHVSDLERSLLCLLAAHPQGLTRTQARSHLADRASNSQVLSGLMSLERRALIEKVVETNQVRFVLQPVILKCVQRLFPQ